MCVEQQVATLWYCELAWSSSVYESPNVGINWLEVRRWVRCLLWVPLSLQYPGFRAPRRGVPACALITSCVSLHSLAISLRNNWESVNNDRSCSCKNKLRCPSKLSWGLCETVGGGSGGVVCGGDTVAWQAFWICWAMTTLWPFPRSKYSI